MPHYDETEVTRLLREAFEEDEPASESNHEATECGSYASLALLMTEAGSSFTSALHVAHCTTCQRMLARLLVHRCPNTRVLKEYRKPESNFASIAALGWHVVGCKWCRLRLVFIPPVAIDSLPRSAWREPGLVPAPLNTTLPSRPRGMFHRYPLAIAYSVALLAVIGCVWLGLSWRRERRVAAGRELQWTEATNRAESRVQELTRQLQALNPRQAATAQTPDNSAKETRLAEGNGVAKKKTPPPPTEVWHSDPMFDMVVDKISVQEGLFAKNLKEYTPMVETYIQNMRSDQDLGRVPISDEYFLGQVRLEQGVQDVNYLPAQKNTEEQSTLHKIFASMKGIKKAVPSRSNKTTIVGGYMSDGFAQMMLIDTAGKLDREHYDFRFVRREFLGSVRTLVIDVKPKEPHDKPMFIGRIWAEDQNYNIVRFNGTYTPQPKDSVYLHFDSWREFMGNNQWLPAYVFSEETHLVRGNHRWNFRGQTLLWGYEALRPNKAGEFTEIVVDTPDKVQDQSDSQQDLTTVAGQRQWQRQAEDNVLDRMQRAALLAPEGDVDRVLETVVQNIEVANNIQIEPEIRCRVLLTQPMESVTVGHTIVVSRGLLDALPDEAALAMILAHEMGHILLSQQINEKYAFSDLMIFPDETTISKLQVKRTPEEEKQADAKGLELLQNSPYKDKLSSAGLFLAAMQADSPELPHLLKGHFGNPLETPEGAVLMSSLVASAPALQVRDVNQIAALPLGGRRIKLNAWSDQLTIQEGRPVRLKAANEKMPFEITPMFPHLTRETQVASTQRVHDF